MFFESRALVDTGATLVGAGGVCKGHNFHACFLAIISGKAHIIAHIQLLAFIVALKAWLHLISNTKFIARLDNMVAVSAINSGQSRGCFINAGLHEIAFLSSMHSFEVHTHHIPGVNNTIPDLLSCWDLQEAAKQVPCPQAGQPLDPNPYQ